MSVKCKSCGREIKEGTKFCQFCGAAVNEESGILLSQQSIQEEEKKETEVTTETTKTASDEKTAEQPRRIGKPLKQSKKKSWIIILLCLAAWLFTKTDTFSGLFGPDVIGDVKNIVFDGTNITVEEAVEKLSV